MRSVCDATILVVLYFVSNETMRRFSLWSRRRRLPLLFFDFGDFVVAVDDDDNDAVVTVSVSSFSSRLHCFCWRRDRLKGRFADRINSCRRFLSMSSSLLFVAGHSRDGFACREDVCINNEFCVGFAMICDCFSDDTKRQTILFRVACFVLLCVAT